MSTIRKLCVVCCTKKDGRKLQTLPRPIWYSAIRVPFERGRSKKCGNGCEKYEVKIEKAVAVVVIAVGTITAATIRRSESLVYWDAWQNDYKKIYYTMD